MLYYSYDNKNIGQGENIDNQPQERQAKSHIKAKSSE
jgi:hypothetical protein